MSWFIVELLAAEAEVHEEVSVLQIEDDLDLKPDGDQENGQHEVGQEILAILLVDLLFHVRDLEAISSLLLFLYVLDKLIAGDHLLLHGLLLVLLLPGSILPIHVVLDKVLLNLLVLF